RVPKLRLGTRRAKLCFAAVAPARETEFPRSRFPKRVWEPGWKDLHNRLGNVSTIGDTAAALIPALTEFVRMRSTSVLAYAVRRAQARTLVLRHRTLPILFRHRFRFLVSNSAS